MAESPQPPAPLAPGRGATLRFAVGHPAGRRSSTWSVVGSRNRRDVYVSARGYMGVAKLSLHESGVWRFAHTESFAAATGIAGDRLIQRITPPEPIAPGWRRAATILVPVSSLREAFPEDVDAGQVSWWPAPAIGRSINFEVLVSDPEPDFDGTATFDCISEVGRIPLLGGGGVWVLADEKDVQPWEASLHGLRQRVGQAVAAAPNPGEDPAALAWGTSDDDGHAIFCDLGDPRLFPAR